MIKVVIDKALQAGDPEKAAFGIVKATIERSLKPLEKEVAREGGSVTITITGPGTFTVDMDKLTPKLRRKISSTTKKLMKPGIPIK